MQFSLAIFALPLLALAQPHNASGHADAISARQLGGLQSLNTTALMDCVSGLTTQACGKAVEGCIQTVINQII